MICPECGATLQRLSGPDGYIVEPRVNIERRDGTTVDVRATAVIYTCPKCEYAQKGTRATPAVS